MFQASVSADRLKDALKSVSVLVDECKIRPTEDEFIIRSVDPANVGMVDLSLHEEGFESYESDGGVLGVNLNRLEDIVGMADSGDIIFMELDEETRKLHIEVDGLSYTLALIDPGSMREEPDIPDLDLPCTIVLEGGYLDQGITACDMVSDHLTMAVYEKSGEQSSDGDGLGFMLSSDGDTDDVEYDPEDYIDISGESTSSLYSLDYISDMNKSISNDAAVTLLLGDDMPVKMHYEFAEGTGKVTYMLAPRLQN